MYTQIILNIKFSYFSPWACSKGWMTSSRVSHNVNGVTERIASRLKLDSQFLIFFSITTCVWVSKVSYFLRASENINAPSRCFSSILFGKQLGIVELREILYDLLCFIFPLFRVLCVHTEHISDYVLRPKSNFFINSLFSLRLIVTCIRNIRLFGGSKELKEGSINWH